MKIIAAPILLIFFLLFMCSICTSAQEENSIAVKQGSRYLDLKIKKLEKYNSRIKRQQNHLLIKLQKQEKHLTNKLKHSDSLGYANLKKQPLSYDSIRKVSKSDTGATAEKFTKKKNSTIDSLKGVASFVQNKSGGMATVPDPHGKNAELNTMQGKLNFRSYINQLITERTNSLKNLQGSEGKVVGLTGIQKQVFYGKAKMKMFKDMEDEPTKAEDKALEYLQGTSGFDKSINDAVNNNVGLQSLSEASSTSASLQKKGFQTKQQMQTNLEKKFGSSVGMIGKNALEGLRGFRDHTKDMTGNVKESKRTLQDLRRIDRPSFNINSMRGLPFWERIEKKYSWQMTHAISNGKQPTLIEPCVMYGFRHTPKLTYGVGFASTIGLGQSWQNIHLSFQGIGMRSFLNLQWQYGIGAYIGYERMYKKNIFIENRQNSNNDVIPTSHNTNNYNESMLIGITKIYRINKKYNGVFQLLYDIWWREKGLQTPIILRFETKKNK